MLMETLALWLILCAAIGILAWLARSWPLALVSSIGLVIAALQYYSDSQDLFVLGMLIMIAFAFPLMIKTKRGRN